MEFNFGSNFNLSENVNSVSLDQYLSRFQISKTWLVVFSSFSKKERNAFIQSLTDLSACPQILDLPSGEPNDEQIRDAHMRGVSYGVYVNYEKPKKQLQAVTVANHVAFYISQRNEITPFGNFMAGDELLFSTDGARALIELKSDSFGEFISGVKMGLLVSFLTSKKFNPGIFLQFFDQLFVEEFRETYNRVGKTRKEQIKNWIKANGSPFLPPVEIDNHDGTVSMLSPMAAAFRSLVDQVDYVSDRSVLKMLRYIREGPEYLSDNGVVKAYLFDLERVWCYGSHFGTNYYSIKMDSSSSSSVVGRRLFNMVHRADESGINSPEALFLRWVDVPEGKVAGKNKISFVAGLYRALQRPIHVLIDIMNFEPLDYGLSGSLRCLDYSRGLYVLVVNSGEAGHVLNYTHFTELLEEYTKYQVDLLNHLLNGGFERCARDGVTFMEERGIPLDYAGDFVSSAYVSTGAPYGDVVKQVTTSKVPMYKMDFSLVSMNVPQEIEDIHESEVSEDVELEPMVQVHDLQEAFAKSYDLYDRLVGPDRLRDVPESEVPLVKACEIYMTELEEMGFLYWYSADKGCWSLLKKDDVSLP